MKIGWKVYFCWCHPRTKRLPHLFVKNWLKNHIPSICSKGIHLHPLMPPSSTWTIWVEPMEESWAIGFVNLGKTQAFLLDISIGVLVHPFIGRVDTCWSWAPTKVKLLLSFVETSWTHHFYFVSSCMGIHDSLMMHCYVIWAWVLMMWNFMSCWRDSILFCFAFQSCILFGRVEHKFCFVVGVINFH